MTDREKLVEIVCQAMQEVDCIEHCNHPPCYEVHHVVDELISHGVTVRELQKPLTVEELFEIAHKCDEGDRTVWMEDATGWADGVVLHVCSILYDSDEEAFVHYMLGDSDDFCTDSAYYGKTWRCWSEKPTEEERKAAEWLE